MTRRNLAWLAPVLILMLLLPLLVACGETSSSPPQQSSAVKEVGVTDDKIKVGAYVGTTGGVALIGKMVDEGSRAYFNRINDEGGINGRKIEWLAEDDVYEPAKTVAMTKKLVETDQVFAIVAPMGTQGTLAIRQYILDNKVPVIGPQGSSAEFFNPPNRYLFSFLPVYFEQGKMLAEIAAKQLGAKSVSMFYLDQAAGKESLDGLQAGAKELGLQVRATESVGVTATDVSSQALKIKQANADVLVVGGSVPLISLLLKEFGMLGYAPPVIGFSMVNDTSLINLAGRNAEGVMALAVTLPVDSDDAGVTQYKNDLKKYFPSSQPSYYSQFSYAVSKTFAEVVKGMGKNVTREGLVKGFESMKDYNNGFMPPLTFTEKDHVGIQKIPFIVQVKDGTWVVKK